MRISYEYTEKMLKQYLTEHHMSDCPNEWSFTFKESEGGYDCNVVSNTCVYCYITYGDLMTWMYLHTFNK